MSTPGSASVIVVGVDGGPAGRRALDFALREAVRRGSVVDVITTWSWDGFETLAGAAASPKAVRQHADITQAEQIAAALTELDEAPVVASRIVEGSPSNVLTEASRNADLLVVGSHGYGALRRAVLGSVAQQCIQRSTCPVVVVPAPHESEHAHAEMGSVATLV